MIHPADILEAATRLQATLSSVGLQSLFDLEPMEPIPEGDEKESGEGEEEEEEEAAAAAAALEREPVDEASAPSPPLPGLPVPLSPASKKPKRKRHSYRLNDKFKALRALGKAEALIKASLSAGALFFAVSALEVVSRETGIPPTTLKTWIGKKEEIREAYGKSKLARRRRRRQGGGRGASFPAAEAAVALLVRERRRLCKIVSKAFVLKHLKLEAEKENAALYEMTKFSAEMVNGFMRRNRFSLRYPSCIRSDDLPKAILICRAFHRQLLGILADDGYIKYAKKPLDPSFGRFLLDDRYNGDEVPFRFGRVKSIVSETNESLTHVTWPPGWESRLATLFLLANAHGRIAAAALIFKGAQHLLPLLVNFLTGSFDKPSRKQQAEIASYKAKYPNTPVYFQKKAWIDGAVLTAITKEVIGPLLRSNWAARRVDFAESLLVLDNGPGRTDSTFLGTLSKNRSFLLKLPPNQTGYVQMIDDNVGRIFRDLACDVLEAEIAEMPPDAVNSLSSERKRELMVKGAHAALLQWNSSEKYLAIGRRAALRTGLAMRIDDGCAGVRPNRFPEGYEATIPRTSGAPVTSYFEEELPAAPAVSLVIPTPLPSPSGAPLSVDVASELDGRSVRVSFVAPAGSPLTVHVEPPPPPRRIQEEVAGFDGWSDEEERVFLRDEVSASESSDEEEAGAPYARRSVRRRRWCLDGCDCERPLGSRKCSCERTGDNYCGNNCHCDPSLCRARAPAEDDE
jgi:hypothetical protein